MPARPTIQSTCNEPVNGTDQTPRNGGANPANGPNEAVAHSRFPQDVACGFPPTMLFEVSFYWTMQTDPIGYGDGMNWYNYVHGDPMNGTDSSGTADCTLTFGPPPGSNMATTPDSAPTTTTVVHGCPCKDGSQCITNCQNVAGGCVNPAEDPHPPHIPQLGDGDPMSLHFPSSSPPCRSAPISPAEAAASHSGNRKAFWSERAADGDPLAGTALAIVQGNGFLGITANAKLSAALFERSPGMTFAQNAAEMQQIGVEIMRAHVEAVGKFGESLTSSEVAQYHFDIFANHGLPSTTFGGAPLSGTKSEASMTSSIWMGGC